VIANESVYRASGKVLGGVLLPDSLSRLWNQLDSLMAMPGEVTCRQAEPAERYGPCERRRRVR
jgi:hypothetical protein